MLDLTARERRRKQPQVAPGNELLELLGAWYWELGPDRRWSVLSDNLTEEAGIEPSRWIGQSFDRHGGGDLHAALAGGRRFREVTFAYTDDAGEERAASLSGKPVRSPSPGGRGVTWRGTGRDITAAWREAQRARDAQELLLGSMESISEGFALYDADDRLILFNQNYNFFQAREKSPIFYGARFEDIVRDAAYHGYYPAACGHEDEWIARRIRYHRQPQGVFEIELRDGRWLQIVERRTPSGGTVTINTDVTAVKRRDGRELQAQRLQALGQLTGGVAHDVSNVLLMLECNLDLALQTQSKGGDARAYFEGCRIALELASGLTQRLLAVARQQPLQSRVTDANELVGRLDELLRRTLPRSITIETALNPGLWRVLVDANQLEAAILNLALNSRDAMPAGGLLRIETSNVYLETGWADRQQDRPPGSYVVITVSDTGVGMSRDVASRALEPFFTTKGSGANSGLGLSTAYGFIKQSGGDLEIESKPGAGTSVRLLLPRVDLGPG